MTNTIQTAFIFLISTIFDLYLLVLAIRLILVWERFDFFNPATQFVARLSDVIVKPLRKFIPNVKNIELATVVIIFLLEFIKYGLILLAMQRMPNPFGIMLLACADIIKLIVNTFFYGILLQALLTWVQPFSIMNRILYDFTAPIMRPFQRLVPRMNGLDLSPIPALITLKLIDIIVVGSLMGLGEGIAFG